MSARAAIGLAALVGVLASAGCGGGASHRLSHRQYERTVRSSYVAVRNAFRETRVGSLGELEPRLAAAQARLRGAADRLESGEPPRDVEEHNRELADGLREYAAELGTLREAARTGDRARVARFDARLGTDAAVERIAESLEEINVRGYDLGDIKLD